jgi:hypothetical protein
MKTISEKIKIRKIYTNLKNSMELVSGVVVKEKGQAWSYSPN